MKIITLLFIYNSRVTTQYLGQNMTLCECLRRMYRDMQWIKSVMYEKLWTVALPQIRCKLHDYAKQYDNDERVMIIRTVESCMTILSRNGYGNAIIGRYGGCFEEDIRRFMCERAYHITGFGCTGEFCTNSQCEKGQCTVPKRLAMMEGWECV